MTAKIEKKSSYKLTYETDKVRLEVEDGMARVTKKHGATAPFILFVTELLDLGDMIDAWGKEPR